jgi:hypothetical protein
VPELYRSRAGRGTNQQTGVVVVHCSDPRYQPHFQDFLRVGLRLDRYGLVAIPGGAQTLTLVDYLPKFSWAGWRWLKFLIKLMKPERIVLIAHDDCRWYVDNQFEPDPARLRSRQLEDLRGVRDAIIDRFGVVRVEMYYATLGADGAVFEAT